MSNWRDTLFVWDGILSEKDKEEKKHAEDNDRSVPKPANHVSPHYWRSRINVTTPGTMRTITKARPTQIGQTTG